MMQCQCQRFRRTLMQTVFNMAENREIALYLYQVRSVPKDMSRKRFSLTEKSQLADNAREMKGLR